MKAPKKRNDAERLFEAMGGIDDRFIFEAESYEKKKNRIALRKLLIVAASLTLALTLAATLFIGLMTESDGDNGSNAPSDNAGEGVIASPDGNVGNDEPFGESDDSPDGSLIPPSNSPDSNTGDASITLDNTLESLRDSTAELSADFDRDMLFDGETKIIWKYSDEESYRMCEVSVASDASRLREQLEKKTDFEPVSEPSASEVTDGFWVCFGDGLVYTPYLMTSDGNIGYGGLFDYGCEIEPSREFTELISSIIGGQTAN